MIPPKSAVTNAHPGTDRPKGRATRGLCRDDSLLLGDVASVMPSSVGGERATPDTRHPQVEGLIPGGRLVVKLHDDLGWDHSRPFLWPIDASTWIISTPSGDIYAQKFGVYSKVCTPPIGDDETPEIGSVEFSAIDELSEMVREGRNLALGTRTSMGLTFDNDPTMMCGLGDRLCAVAPVSLAEHIER